MSTSTSNIFSYPTYSSNNYNDSSSSDEDYDEYSLQEIEQLNKLDRTKTAGKTGTVIPNITKDYHAAVAYKKAKRLARQEHEQEQEAPNNNNNNNNNKHTELENEHENEHENLKTTKRLSKNEINSIINHEIESPEKFISSSKVFNRIKYDLDDELKDKITITYQNNGSDKYDYCCFKKYDDLHLNAKITEIKFGNNNQIVWSKADHIYDFHCLLE